MNKCMYVCIIILCSCCQHVKEYASILSAVKGGPNEKRLASQFIARFFRHFPDLAEQALNAQFDLCEDEDLHVRLTIIIVSLDYAEITRTKVNFNKSIT